MASLPDPSEAIDALATADNVVVELRLISNSTWMVGDLTSKFCVSNATDGFEIGPKNDRLRWLFGPGLLNFQSRRPIQIPASLLLRGRKLSIGEAACCGASVRSWRI